MNTREAWRPLGLGTLLVALGCACSGAEIEEPEAQDPADGEQELGTARQAWSVIACGRESTTPNVTFDGFIDGFSFTSPTVYNRCTKSFILEVHDVDAAYAGSGRDANARFEVVDVGPLPQNQADCEQLGGGAIFYQRSSDAWVPLTEQVTASGRWAPGLFGGGMTCFPPAVSFEGDGGLEEGATYRIAATYRNGANVTRPIRFDHSGPVTIR